MRKLAQCKFVISPPGNGWSNHREWEAINLGAVPVVLKHPRIDTVYGLSSGESRAQAGGQLPVLSVESYEQVTIPFLERAWHKFDPEAEEPRPSFSMERAYFPFWLAEITQWME